MSESALSAPFDLNKILRRLLPIICIGVLGNLAYSWYTADRGHWQQSWLQFSPAWLMLAAVLSVMPWFWHCVRLAIWGRFFGVKISRRNLLRIAVATDVGAAVAPQAVGGAPLKISMLVQQGYSPGKATTLTLLSGVEDLVFFSLAIPVSLLLTRPWENPLWQQAGQAVSRYGHLVWPALMVLFAVFLLVKKLYRSRQTRGAGAPARWQHLVADFKTTVKLIYTDGRTPFLLSVLALIAQWLTRFSILLAVLLALGMPDDLLQFFLLQWMVFVAMLLTPTPGATGGAEAAFLLVFSKNIPSAAAGVIMAGWRFLTYYFMLLSGVVILWLLRERAGLAS